MEKRVVFLYVYKVRNLMFKQQKKHLPPSFYTLLKFCHTFVKSGGNKISKKINIIFAKNLNLSNIATHQSCTGA